MGEIIIPVPTPAQQRQIIIQAFNISAVNALNYSLPIAGAIAKQTIYNGKIGKPSPQDEPQWTSKLGTPVWDTLILNGDEYQDNIYGKTRYNEMRFDACLMTLTQTHNVVLTPIQGRDGEVIEYIGKASFRINFKGGIFGEQNIRPTLDLINFKLMLGSNQPISVKSSGFLNEWDISEFAILEKEVPQIMGGYSYQLFEFNAIQDLPVILAQAPLNNNSTVSFV